MDKKNFSFKEFQYSIVIGKRNYLEYYVQHRTSTHKKRVITSKGFSISNDFDVLKLVAENHLKQLATNEIAKPISKLHEYINNQKYRYKERTFEQFNGVVDRFVSWCNINKIIPHKINFMQCQKFINEFSVKKSNGTIWNNILVLKTIFNGLIKEKTIAENVFALLPKIKRNPTSLAVYNSNQIKAIKEYCMENDKQMYLAILLLYSCAIRPNELRNLQLFDIDFERNLIEIKSESAKNSKTQKVYLPDHVKNALLILANFPNYYYLFGKKGMPTAEKISANFLNDKHRQILKLLKINGRYALYSWKHTGVVAMVRAGINIKLIQLQLRHSSLDMTNEYLKNLGISDNDDLKNKMPIL